MSFVRDYTPNPATTGLPKYYAVFDENTFILAPTPDSNYTFELHYKHRPASLTARLTAEQPGYLLMHLMHCCMEPWLRLLLLKSSRRSCSVRTKFVSAISCIKEDLEKVTVLGMNSDMTLRDKINYV